MRRTPRGIALDQRRDGVQRVEEEVRVELHPQRVQPRLGELRLQLRGLRLLLPLAQEELAREAGGQHGEVDEQLIEKRNRPISRNGAKRAPAPRAWRRPADRRARIAQQSSRRVDDDGDADADAAAENPSQSARQRARSGR